MFRSYDHLQAEMYLPENYSTDNGSVVSRILVNIMNDYSDRFIVSRLLLDAELSKNSLFVHKFPRLD
jgi:hypothetical protein